MEMAQLAGVAALIAIAALAGWHEGHKRGEAHTYRLFRNRVDLNKWYASEPRVRQLAHVSDIAEGEK